jgi:hypothetical protein
MLIGAQFLQKAVVRDRSQQLGGRTTHMYISLLPSLLNQVHAKVAGPFLRLFTPVSDAKLKWEPDVYYSQLGNRNHELANAVDARIIAAVLAVLAHVLVHGRRREVVGFVGKDGRAAADDAVDGLERGRLVPVASVDGLIVGDAELA